MTFIKALFDILMEHNSIQLMHEYYQFNLLSVDVYVLWKLFILYLLDNDSFCHDFMVSSPLDINCVKRYRFLPPKTKQTKRRKLFILPKISCIKKASNTKLHIIVEIIPKIWFLQKRKILFISCYQKQFLHLDCGFCFCCSGRR